jgi:hypothetical protein
VPQQRELAHRQPAGRQIVVVQLRQ